MFREIKESTLPEWRKNQIRALWRTRGDSFSRAQLREILKIEQRKRAMNVDA
jgi:hypothetical protein